MEETDLRTSELQEISHPPVMEHISAFSPSSSATFEQCPKQWYFKYVAKLPDPKGEDAVLGTFTHSVLELLLQEPADNRTKAKAKEKDDVQCCFRKSSHIATEERKKEREREKRGSR